MKTLGPRYRVVSMMRFFRLAALLLAVCEWPASASAQGYGFYEQDACAMGRAGAGVAAPCNDGSAIFYNPAGLTFTPGTLLNFGATAVAPRGQFTNDTTLRVSPLSKRTFVVPALYFARPVAPRVAVGIGLFAPYGLTSDWPVNSEGRFLGYRSSITALYVQPTVAFRMTDRVSVGAGVDVTRASVELRRRIDLAPVPLPDAQGVTFQAFGVPPGTDFANADLTGSGFGVGAHFGAILKAGENVSLGVRYLLRQHVDINNAELSITPIPTGLVLRAPLPGVPAGTPIDLLVAPQFRPGASLSSQSATTTVPFPDQLVVGGAIRPNTRLTLLVDYQFTDWSLFDQVVIKNQLAPPSVLIESYRNTHGIRVGAEYTFAKGAAARAGFDAHTAGAPDQSVTPLIPEAQRREYTAGVAIPLFSRMKLDVAYQFVDQQDRRGRTTDGGLAVPTVAINNGLYQYHANLLGISVVLGF
jgi:long-chain fatty acid transport protein